jgi:hypothetical protein
MVAGLSYVDSSKEAGFGREMPGQTGRTPILSARYSLLPTLKNWETSRLSPGFPPTHHRPLSIQGPIPLIRAGATCVM